MTDPELSKKAENFATLYKTLADYLLNPYENDNYCRNELYPKLKELKQLYDDLQEKILHSNNINLDLINTTSRIAQELQEIINISETVAPIRKSILIKWRNRLEGKEK